MKCNFAQSVIDQSQSYPHKIAYYDGTDQLTYKQLAKQIQQTAGLLKKLNIRAGDCVIIIMEDCVDWPVAFLACVYVGAVPLPISTVMPVELFDQIAEFADCKLILAGEQSAKRIGNTAIPMITRAQLRVDSTVEPATMMHPDSPGYMSLSSGTTGLPKIAVHRHRVFYEGVKIGSAGYGMTADSVILSVPKMSWGYGLHNSVTITVGLGATAIVIPDLPSPSIIFDYITKFEPTIVATSPAIIKKLLGPAGKKFTMPGSVQRVVSSSEDLPSELYNQFYKRFGRRLETAIGMLEVANINYCSTSPVDHAPGTVGKPIDSVKIQVINDAGVVCDANQVGEVQVSSSLNAMYYLKNYQQSQETFVGKWVRTGDYGYINNDGNLVFVGRANDIFKVGDLIVSPVEIENELIKNNTIQQIAITGVANAKGVVEVHAFVVVKESFDQTEFENFIQARLMPHQRPKHIHLVDGLPETITNKKDRRALTKLIEKNVIKL